ncbi:MAG: hypothetical protein ACETWC_04655 [Acidobacteriota bacterium]
MLRRENYLKEEADRAAKKVVQHSSVSGREERIRELIIKEMTPLVDKLEVDTLGNIIGLKKITLRYRLQTG